MTPSSAFVARAPGRVELMGSHTDYNGGLVLTLPIDLETRIAVRPRADRIVSLRSAGFAGVEFSLDAIARAGDWGDYVRGVAVELARAGFALSGFEGDVSSTLPIGGGLSSSAALECAAAAAFEALGGWHAPPETMAEICQRAENAFVGVPCGILDQFSACVDARGGAIRLDCRDRSWRSAPIADGIAIVTADTGVRRELARSGYAARRGECEAAARMLGVARLADLGGGKDAARVSELPAPLDRRARFILEEIARVDELAAALVSGDRPRIARATAGSFRGACDEFEIAIAEMRAMHAALVEAPGFLGARQSGAGFGGCLVAFAEIEAVDRFVHATVDAYRRTTGAIAAVRQVRPGVSARASA